MEIGNTSIHIHSNTQPDLKPHHGLEKGKMAELVYSMRLVPTPLGPIEKWPQSLRTTVSLCLASNFPISIAWGRIEYKSIMMGTGPSAGINIRGLWGKISRNAGFRRGPSSGEAFEQASLGQTRFLENQRTFLDRYGYLEETFFTFSFSPILDESGGVGGLFHPVTELTQQTLAERRLNILRSIADRTLHKDAGGGLFSDSGIGKGIRL